MVTTLKTTFNGTNSQDGFENEDHNDTTDSGKKSQGQENGDWEVEVEDDKTVNPTNSQNEEKDASGKENEEDKVENVKELQTSDVEPGFETVTEFTSTTYDRIVFPSQNTTMTSTENTLISSTEGIESTTENTTISSTENTTKSLIENTIISNQEKTTIFARENTTLLTTSSSLQTSSTLSPVTSAIPSLLTSSFSISLTSMLSTSSDMSKTQPTQSPLLKIHGIDLNDNVLIIIASIISCLVIFSCLILILFKHKKNQKKELMRVKTPPKRTGSALNYEVLQEIHKDIETNSMKGPDEAIIIRCISSFSSPTPSLPTIESRVSSVTSLTPPPPPPPLSISPLNKDLDWMWDSSGNWSSYANNQAFWNTR